MIELSEHDSKLRLAGLPIPAEIQADNVDEAVAFAAQQAPGRLVAKASGVAHKTEGNLVRLGLDATGLADCFEELAAAGDGTMLVAEMVDIDIELIVGVLRDPTFGLVVTMGAGGITAEASPDVVALLAPPEPGEVATALQQLRIAPLLNGWRGAPAVDIDALSNIVDVVVAAFEDPEVIAVDCNPVALTQGRPIVLDALVILDDAGSPAA